MTTHSTHSAAKTVAITGGARGIGYQTAKELIRRGHRVAIGDVDEKRAQEAATELGVNIVREGGDRFEIGDVEGQGVADRSARSTDQVRANAAAGSVPELPAEFLDGVEAIYDRHLRAAIHPRW